MFGMDASDGILIRRGAFPAKRFARRETAQTGLTLAVDARILGRWRSASVKQPLLYRSRPVRPGDAGTAVNLTPRALGWRTIHFAVRQLTTGTTWRALAPREERCLVLLRGAFRIEW